jgi:glycosyltransferase involved in cell wall biosynthesis
MKPKVCFFARVREREMLHRFEFYAQDIQILRDLGFEVQIATHPLELRSADFYFVWWWTWAIFPLTMARLYRRPTLITGTFDVKDFNTKPSWHRKLIRHALKHADANVFVSQMEYVRIPKQFQTGHPCYAPHIVNTGKYKPNGIRSESLVLSVGWLESGNSFRKGMLEVIRAAPLVHRDHPEVCFVIAGQKGSDYPALERIVRELGAESYVKFAGLVSTEKKIQLMQECTLYLQPSRFEGFGLAILESMSCGAAVVTTSVGAVPEVVGDTAILVDVRSPESIAKQVSRLLTERPLRMQLGENARRRAETVFPYARRLNDLNIVISRILTVPLRSAEALRANNVTTRGSGGCCHKSENS